LTKFFYRSNHLGVLNCLFFYFVRLCFVLWRLYGKGFHRQRLFSQFKVKDFVIIVAEWKMMITCVNHVMVDIARLPEYRRWVNHPFCILFFDCGCCKISVRCRWPFVLQVMVMMLLLLREIILVLDSHDVLTSVVDDSIVHSPCRVIVKLYIASSYFFVRKISTSIGCLSEVSAGAWSFYCNGSRALSGQTRVNFGRHSWNAIFLWRWQIFLIRKIMMLMMALLAKRVVCDVCDVCGEVVRSDNAGIGNSGRILKKLLCDRILVYAFSGYLSVFEIRNSSARVWVMSSWGRFVMIVLHLVLVYYFNGRILWVLIARLNREYRLTVIRQMRKRGKKGKGRIADVLVAFCCRSCDGLSRVSIQRIYSMVLVVVAGNYGRGDIIWASHFYVVFAWNAGSVIFNTNIRGIVIICVGNYHAWWIRIEIVSNIPWIIRRNSIDATVVVVLPRTVHDWF